LKEKNQDKRPQLSGDVLKQCCARVRFSGGLAEIDTKVKNVGIAGVELEQDQLHVTLTEQPALRPLVLCPGAKAIYGNEYREFYLQLGKEALVDMFVDFVAIFQ